MAIEDRELLRFDAIGEFRAWLEEHEDDTPGIRLVFAKKGAPYATVTYDEALDVALEHGWIDGRAKGIDEHCYEQYFTPRGPRSVWSLRNVEIVERKIAAGEMKARGLAEVERAKSDGRWDRAYAGSKNAQPHPDLLAALEANPAAKATYDGLSAQNRFAIYFRLHNLKRPETVARTIERFVEMLARGETLY